MMKDVLSHKWKGWQWWKEMGSVKGISSAWPGNYPTIMNYYSNRLKLQTPSLTCTCFNSSGHGLYKVSKVFHRDAGPCWLLCFPQLGQAGWMTFRCWAILDTHGKLLSMKNTASIAVLDRNRCSWHLLPYLFQRHLQFVSYPFYFWMAHMHNPCLNCLKSYKSFFNLSPHFWSGFNRWHQ